MSSGLIMVVEDDVHLRRIYQDALTALGYTVVCAENGAKCLSLLHRAKPKVILMDIMMPGLDGIETCRRLRRMEGGASPAVLFLTASDDAALVKQCLAAGGDDYMIKQSNMTAIVSRVARWTNRATLVLHRRQMQAKAEARDRSRGSG